MKLILEDSFEGLSYNTEINESNGDKTYVVSGTFSTPDKKNRNGRVYSKKIWEDNVHKYQDHINNNSVNTLMEAEHPPRTTVDMWKAVGKIRKLEMREGIVYGEATILNNNSPESNQLKALIDAGIPIGVSTRGTGRMKGSVVEEYDLVTVDFVSSPSDYGANLKGLVESQSLFSEDWILKDKEFSMNKSGHYICTSDGCSLSEESEVGSPDTPDTDGMSQGTSTGSTGNKCSRVAQELMETLNNFTDTKVELTENEKIALDLMGVNDDTDTPDTCINETRWDKALRGFQKGSEMLRNELKGWDKDILEEVDEHLMDIEELVEKVGS